MAETQPQYDTLAVMVLLERLRNPKGFRWAKVREIMGGGK